VVISHLFLHGYVAQVKEQCGRPVVVDLHNAEAHLCADIAAHPGVGMVDGGYIDAERAMAVEHIEAAVVNRADHVTVPAGPHRQRLLRRHRRPTRVSVVPNTVTACEPADPAGATRIESVVFVGALSYFPNLLAARELCGATGAAARAAVPRLRLTVVGRNPSPALAEAAAAADVRLVADPESVRPFLDQAILVVPLAIGGGTRFKILEAMATGCPVVSTAKGIEGIGALPGVHYLPAAAGAHGLDVRGGEHLEIGDTPAASADACVRLLADPVRAERLAAAAHDRYLERYQPEVARCQARRAAEAAVGAASRDAATALARRPTRAGR
jgi:glycosyltransferase involved in cell wall biosynthesis